MPRKSCTRASMRRPRRSSGVLFFLLWSFAAGAQQGSGASLFGPETVTPPTPPPTPAELQVTVPSSAAPTPPMPQMPVASPRPTYTVAEPTSGLPPGRLIPLPVMGEKQVRELAADLALHLEVTGGYRRIAAGKADTPPSAPEAVTSVATLERSSGGGRSVLRRGFVIPPRRPPPPLVQGLTPTAGAGGPD